MDSANTFLPVPPIPKAFNKQLQRSAVHLSLREGQAKDHPGGRDWDLNDRVTRYGSNEMPIPVTSVPMLIFHEMWHPFYCFQYFSIVVWYVDGIRG